MTPIKVTPTDKHYKLMKTAAPLSFTLPVRNTRRYPLLWFDETTNSNRALRYAVNQSSPFEDKQDGNSIVEPIIFERGFLSVPRNNPVLQQFLHYHPLNGKAFMEVNKEADASKQAEALNLEVDALIEARALTLEQLEAVSRVLFGKDPSMTSTAELKRDILIYAKKDPKGLLNILSDPSLKLKSNVHVFFDSKLLGFRNGQKEVWFNTPSNKKRALSVPFGVDPYEAVMEYLKTDEGIDALKMLENNL
jgi:hypothetical protein